MRYLRSAHPLVSEPFNKSQPKLPRAGRSRKANVMSLPIEWSPRGIDVFPDDDWWLCWDTLCIYYCLLSFGIIASPVSSVEARGDLYEQLWMLSNIIAILIAPIAHVYY